MIEPEEQRVGVVSGGVQGDDRSVAHSFSSDRVMADG